MFRLFHVVALAVFAASLPSHGLLAQDRWLKIADSAVEPSAEAVSIAIPDGVTGKAIRLQAPDGAVAMQAIVVNYGKGRVHLEERPINLLKGERTRPINLATEEQPIGAVNLILDTRPRTGKATVELWALTSRPSLGLTQATSGQTPIVRDGFVLIGKSRTGMIAFDKGKSPAPANKGFKTLKLENKGREVTVDSVIVNYKDGGREMVDLGQVKLGAGQATEVPLPTVKPVADVEVRSRARIFDKSAKGDGGGVIEILGKTEGGPGAPEPVPTQPTKTRGIGGTRGADPPRTVAYSYDLETLDACVKTKACTAVPVFFGTDRNPTTAKERITFGPDRAGKMQLGRVYVTVPRKNRQTGQLNVPGTWDWLRGTPEGGDPNRHFTIPKTGVTVFASADDFIASVKDHIANGNGTFKDHAFIYVHGYRVPWEFAAMRTAQIAYDLSPDDAPFGTPFLYSWPSSGAAADYGYDLDSSRYAIPHLKTFIRLVAEQTGATNVHIIAHSMGNFPVVHALNDLSAAAPAIKINQVILAAPDVDKGEFEQVAAGVTRIAKGVTLYASSSDIALLLSRLGRRNTPRAGDAKEPPGPAIVPGIDTVDISSLSTGFLSYFSWNHDKYADSPVLLNDISSLFRKGERPPSSRNLSFRPQPPLPAVARFWRYAE